MKKEVVSGCAYNENSIDNIYKYLDEVLEIQYKLSKLHIFDKTSERLENDIYELLENEYWRVKNKLDDKEIELFIQRRRINIMKNKKEPKNIEEAFKMMNLNIEEFIKNVDIILNNGKSNTRIRLERINIMEIKTKYEIGQHIWVVYEDRGEVSVYDTTIDSIFYDKDGLSYCTKEANDYPEEAIIPYENSAQLIAKITELMNTIHEREEKDNDNI